MSGAVTPRPVALVTGATAGIGLAFARELAARDHDLVLVARDEVRLATVADELRRAGAQVEVMPADLTDRAALDRVAARLRETGPGERGTRRPVDVLVNNAGFGLKQHFIGGDLAAEEAMLDVLVRAVLVLTHAAVPGMVARGRGSIVTVSSVASFLQGGTYSAAKAWATTFTASLSHELTGTGVTATALCPGYVRTEFHQRMGVKRQIAPDWAWLAADRLVADCLDDVAKGRAISVPSRRYRAVVTLARHAPLSLQRRVAARR